MSGHSRGYPVILDVGSMRGVRMYYMLSQSMQYWKKEGPRAHDIRYPDKSAKNPSRLRCTPATFNTANRDSSCTMISVCSNAV